MFFPDHGGEHFERFAIAELQQNGSHASNYVLVMAASCAGVWAIALALMHLAKFVNQKHAEAAAAEPEAACTDWRSSSIADEASALVQPHNQEETVRSDSCGAVGAFTIVMSLPALLGTWCWPIVLSAALGGVAELESTQMRAMSHAFSWGINFGLFSSVAVYLALQTPIARRKVESDALRWAPFMIMVVASLMVMVDLTRHVCLDLGGSEFYWMAMYENGGLSLVGRIGLVLTWVGMALFAFAFAWFSGAHKKLHAAFPGLFPAFTAEC